MVRVALRGIAGRKLRTTLTALAVVLGVAMVAGSFVLTDTISKAFDGIFASSYRQTDAVVSARKLTDYSAGGKGTIPASALARVRALPDVAAATGAILDFSGDADQAKLVRDGKVIGADGGPTFGFGVDASEPRFNPFTLDRGHWASGPGEVVVDAQVARSHHVRVGDRIGVAADGPVREFTVSGIARIGGVDSLGGSTFAVFDVRTAQALLHKRGFDAISVGARPGVSSERLVRELRAVVPADAQVRTGGEQAREDGKSVAGFVKFIRWLLLAFGGVALLVGGFVIFNTLAITVAQRTRELATLRTLGASRSQVRRAVVVEALVVGLGASVVGLGAGVGLAKLLSSLMSSIGLGLPQAGTVFALRTVLVSLLLGTAVTVLAGLVPALRATRVPPIAAVREGVRPGRPRFSRRATLVALFTLAAAAALLGYGIFGHGIAAGPRILAIAVGALALFLGVALVAPRLVRPITALVAWPSRRFGGVAGSLASENALRNPGRTATTAAALAIGLALVSFVAVLGKGLRDSDANAVNAQLRADYVVAATDGWQTLPVAAGRAAASAPGVVATSSVRLDRARFAGDNLDVSGVDAATISRFYRFEWKSGSLAGLAGNGAIVRSEFARKHELAIGDALPLTTPAGSPVSLRVRGIYASSRLDALLGSVLVSNRTFDARWPHPSDEFTFVAARGDARAGLERALAAFPDAKVRTQDEFVAKRSAWLKQVLNLLYVLLALSVVVSLLGMVNTLVLAVFERTRELGMLRAIGLSRRQARRMIRHESVLTSLLGAAIGLPLGILLAAIVTRALHGYGVSFSFPLVTIVTFVAVAAAAGLAAAVMPARRASRLSVLGALQYE